MITKKQQLEMLIKEQHSSAINHTTSRTVSYQSGAFDSNFSRYANQLNPSSDDEYNELKQYGEDRFQPILEAMIFNDKEFIVVGKLQGKEIIFKEKNNVTGNKVTIKFDNISEYGKLYNESKMTITRK